MSNVWHERACSRTTFFVLATRTIDDAVANFRFVNAHARQLAQRRFATRACCAIAVQLIRCIRTVHVAVALHPFWNATIGCLTKDGAVLTCAALLLIIASGTVLVAIASIRVRNATIGLSALVVIGLAL